MDFERKITDIHKGRIELISEYVNMRTNVTLRCNSCNNIYTTKAKTAVKSGCPECSLKNKTTSLDIFITKSQNCHGDKYDYSKVVYKNNHTPVTIVCPEHGDFKQTPSVHYRSGCPECAKDFSYKNEFLKKAQEIHKGVYDYARVEYKHSQKRVNIVCKTHGSFQQTPAAHLQGYGCPECGKSKKNENSIKEELQKLYPYYGLENFNYQGSLKPITMTCPAHGDFNTRYYLAKRGDVECPKCKKQKHKNKQLIKFKDKAKFLHEGKYSYEHVNYTTYHDNVTIVCPEHGEFKQTVLNHLQGKGCSKCSALNLTSKPQQEILEFIESIYVGKIITNTPKLENKHIDIFLEDLKLGIEVNGIYWHSEFGGNPKTKKYHLEKTIIADNNSIQLLHITDVEWTQKRNIVESVIKNKLGIHDQRIFARKCEIKKIDNKSYKHFCIENHLQGFATASIIYGLYFNDELISVMSFSKSRYNKHDWEMIRYCCRMGVTIIGGAKRLFKHFTRQHKGNIVTYSDRRFFDGRLYKSLGFVFSHNTKPNYHYFQGYNINTVKLESRVKYQKHKLYKLLENFNPDLTEIENMLNHGFDRIWDCGNKVWVFEN